MKKYSAKSTCAAPLTNTQRNSVEQSIQEVSLSERSKYNPSRLPKAHSVVFVCLGNVNRSCAAEYILKAHCPQLKVSSCGTGGHFHGDSAMPEMVRSCRHRGVDLSPHRARQINQHDFENFDLVISVDTSVYECVKTLCPHTHTHKLRLLLKDYAPQLCINDVPDPYYEGGHERTFEFIRLGIEGLISIEAL
eukprot:GHVR01124167.1.p1 GENE.GHVR01124167.1~~GHVR01124167.1.p1  ORF type:complete len:206 (+),score=45.88 GHVR01124167.1:43-618(+)